MAKRMAPSKSPETSSPPCLRRSYRVSSTRRACSTPSRGPARVTWFPRCSATTPSLRSSRARFCPYCPNSVEASRLSSKASTNCAAGPLVVTIEGDARDPFSIRGDRNGFSAPCLHVSREHAEQAVRARFGDPYRRNFADQGVWCHDLNRLQIWGSADDLARMTPRFFEQDIEGALNTVAIESRGITVDRGLHTAEPFQFRILSDLIRYGRSRRSGTRRVFEREGSGIADFVNEREGRLDVLFALAGETDDEIGGARHVRARSAHARDHLQVIGSRVLAVHQCQHAIGAGLRRDVQTGHQRRQVAMRGSQARLHVARMAGGVAQARNTGHLGNAEEKSAERPDATIGTSSMIGIDVLADKRDLTDPRIRKPFHFGNDMGDRARSFSPARVRHDAERAELIAAFLHSDEGRYAARPDRLPAWDLELLKLVFDGKLGVDDPTAALGAREQLGQAVIGLRADDEIHRGRTANDLGPLRLGDTAGDGNIHPASGTRSGLL